ncbi:MAG TPA: twin-arginine translocase subunit TatC [Candidatus Krumholzibacteria bacterium]|nr:twin-arginine translocase subunit TatC [Candidatus Krumholzibacteria bacterium]
MRPIREPARTELLREMSFWEHLGELRSVLASSIAALLGLSIVFWCFSGPIMEWMVAGVPVDHLTFLAPSEAFMTRTKMSFVLGGLAAFPYISYRLWRFVSPGLFRRERKRIFPVAFASGALFYSGIVFAYFLVVPVIIQFMLGYATDRIQPMIAVGAYFDTISRLCLAFGLVFQLPIVILLLGLMGIVSPRTFLRQWRYAVVIIFTAAAIFTPPDPVSQVLMAVPLVVLYVGSSFIALALTRKRRKPEDDS